MWDAYQQRRWGEERSQAIATAAAMSGKASALDEHHARPERLTTQPKPADYVPWNGREWA